MSDAKEARKSVFRATTWIGYFYILIFIIGFGATALVLTKREFADVSRSVIHGGEGTSNMAAVLVATLSYIRCRHPRTWCRDRLA